jgi:hypothetical protein
VDLKEQLHEEFRQNAQGTQATSQPINVCIGGIKNISGTVTIYIDANRSNEEKQGNPLNPG